MATTLTSSVQLMLRALFANPAIGVAISQATIDRSTVISLADGFGANQCDRVYSETRTLAASASVTLDLAGVLLDAFGSVITFARIKAIIIAALAANTNNVVMGAAAGTQFLGPLGSATDTVHVRPGGILALVAPDVTAWPVGAGATDLLKFTNSAAGTGVTYDLILLGASA
ncbi:MAG TPA: hypothetical protein VK575_11750 [Gemmatimonadaceae bacterium]|nr:hypothetical protein [Gemmatimonadaceae bacterium]